MTSGGTIYAIGSPGTLWVKIGCTTLSVDIRLKQIQHGTPTPLTIIAAAPVAADLLRIERQIHRILADVRRQGEWFATAMNKAILTALITEARKDIREMDAVYADPSMTPQTQAIAGTVPDTVTDTPAYAEPVPVTAAPAPQTLGAMIRATRLGYGMTVAELARRTQLSAVALSAIEHGRVALPNFAVVASIARALKVSLDTFAEADMPSPSRKKPARTPRTRKAKEPATATVTDTAALHKTPRRRKPQAAPAD